MAFYGRMVTSGDAAMGDVGENQQRAFVYNKATENGWGYRLGFWGGGYIGGGNPTVRIGAWAVSGSLTPAHRLAYTNAFTITAKQSYGSDGQAYEYNVTHAETSPGDNAIKMYAGHRYTIGLVATNNPVHFAMVPASGISADNEQMYHRGGVSLPTDPFNYSSSSTQGWMAAWIEYQPNRKPHASCSSPSGLITDTTPTFEGTFSDPDSEYGDRMSRYRIQVIDSDNDLVWDSGTLVASSSDQANEAFSRNSGVSLTSGGSYQWRCQVADDFGTWSSWTAYESFTVNGGGAVITLGSTPSGKQDSDQPSPFTATWAHSSGRSTQKVQVRLKQGNGVIRMGYEVSKSVANGNTISLTWAQAFGSYDLQWGVDSYSWEMIAQDTAGVWTDWSPAVLFTTDAPPSIPFYLHPSGGDVYTSYPKLRCKVVDPDDATVTVKARIKKADGTVWSQHTMSHVGYGFYEWQTTSSDLLSHANYSWDAYAFDGTLYSGGSETSFTASADQPFTYAEGPTVEVTSPIGDVTSSSPTFTWDASDQVKYQVALIHDGETIYSTGNVITTNQFHTIPSGYIRNGEDYTFIILVIDSNGLQGYVYHDFSVAYTPSDPITGLTASAEYQRLDLSPTSIRLSWDASSDPDFAEYVVTRSFNGDSVIIGRISSSTQTVFVDHLPVSGADYTYSVQQAIAQGLDIIASEPVSVQASILIEHVVLVDVHDTENRVGLHFDSDRGIQHLDDLVLEQGWGDAAPTGVYGTAQFDKFSGEFTLATDELGTAQDYITALRSLWKARATVCYRDERGRKFFGKINKFGEQDRRVQSYTVRLDLNEVAYSEGVG